ncbi:MAG: Rnf-Nqr domain containing protein [Candidatus Alcyoniella australis]|nr:Rnf-Nqr domain containing protein [Candidatus Alcyoniella australis]
MEPGPIAIFFAAIFTSNILLVNFLGMCSFLSISRELKASVGLGLAVTFVLTTTSLIAYLLNQYVLVPLEMEHLRYIVFIVVIAAFVQLVEIVIERISPVLYVNLGIFLPLITVNCAILGSLLFLVIREYDLWQSLAFGAGSGLGWMLAIVALAGIRQRMKYSKVPAALEGPGIALIITGLMSLAFVGFSGMIPIQ